MTDFNSINPDKNLNANLNPKRQNQGGAPDPNAGNAQNPNPPADPYADLKTDPGKMLNLMAAQGLQNIQGQIENPGIEKSVAAFSGSITPERHAQVTQLMAQTYQNETGKAPQPGVLQELVDDYLIGKPVIQQA